MIINKKEFIEELTKWLEDDSISILQAEMNNESKPIYKNGWAENVLTGHTDIKIRLINKDQHKKFVEKLQS